MSTSTVERPVAAPERVPGRRRRRRVRPGLLLSYLFLAVLVFWALLPLVVMVATSLKPSDEIFSIPPRLLPEHVTFEHYTQVFRHSDMPKALLNSVYTGLLVTAVTLLLGCCTGYAISRIRFPGSRGLAVALLLGQLLPATVLLLPLFKIVADLDLIDRIPGLALVHLVFVLPLVTWMLISTFSGIPVELEEAAMVDGCSRLAAVVRVVLPVAAPGLAAVGIFGFLESWNEFLFASVITLSDRSQTAPVALTAFAGQFDTDWGATMAGATVIAAPIMIAFLTVQRFFIQGLSAGAVKG